MAIVSFSKNAKQRLALPQSERLIICLEDDKQVNVTRIGVIGRTFIMPRNGTIQNNRQHISAPRGERSNDVLHQ